MTVRSAYAAAPAAAVPTAVAPTAVAPAAAAPAAADAPLPVLGTDVEVPLADGRRVPYAALDQAASAPALRRVWDDVAAYAPLYGSVHRGAGYLSQLSTDLFEESRRTVAAFLDLRDGDQVVFTRSTTDSLNLLASAVPAGTRVLVFETEHHAALLPWRREGITLTCLPAPRSPQQAVAAVEEALADGPDGPALLCVTGASNVTGEVWPVAELAAAAHRHGARVVLDAAQLAPHERVSVRELGVDWAAFSGHKLYAPFGAGVLAGRADWLDAAEPYLAGGGASRTVARQAGGALAVDWHRGPARHEAGSPNVVGAHAVASACRALTQAGFEALRAREQRLLARLREGLAEVPGVRVLTLFGEDHPRVGVLSFTVRGWNSSHVAAALSAEYGIGVRDGLFCAHPLVRTLLGGTGEEPSACGAPDASLPGGRSLNAVRVSFGAGTPDEHVERFLAALRELVAEGARWSYRTEGGRCVPDTRRR
ncbi:aminotransferase class V-fold PLP-dependent enzyme [Streptacidiphilus sp. ASG 303]|uniref:aminotransferase class V-fold PLP-dependent enzyme n=1 Tax=Streptacidiphilus sp. ASG 303 TaxID=2896847 RepID=UPI001E496642|nr:aminotransferase class V-fold PLP-dependent enzyme [Streptacidiphilus sp. ASG 303]MCD0481692.1 aminotransferase class V-fold PLP-dependent enzyme [Streptacidiphilus sp. ASG 303]